MGSRMVAADNRRHRGDFLLDGRARRLVRSGEQRTHRLADVDRYRIVTIGGVRTEPVDNPCDIDLTTACRRDYAGEMTTTADHPLRIVVAKPGLDGHDRGAKVVARALRDAGMEVIYTGLHQTPEQIVEAAIQEDADAVGLSVLSGAHMTLFAKVVALLKERDAADIVVFGGGIIPQEDLTQLAELGVGTVFTPGATTTEIVGWVRANVRAD